MPPRSSWKGFIKLSLVSVPVKAYTANATGSEIHLNQLHAECNNRIRYQKACPEHGEVGRDEIVSGYEFAKGQYVVIDPDEVSKLRTQSDKSVQIDGFVASDSVDPMHFSGKTHYLVPDGPVGQKPYALLRDEMADGGYCAFGQIVMSGREQLVMLRPLDGLIVMTGVTYDNRVKKPDSFRDEIVATDMTKEERKLTRTLIEASMIADFDLGAYTDTYTENLTRLIESKVEGKEIVAVPDPEEPQIINLMEALKQSVARAQTSSEAKMAPSKTTRKKPAGKASKKTPKKAAKKKTG